MYSKRTVFGYLDFSQKEKTLREGLIFFEKRKNPVAGIYWGAQFYFYNKKIDEKLYL